MDALMEMMAIITSRLDAHAADTRQLMQRKRCAIILRPLLSTSSSCLQYLLLLHHSSRMPHPYTPPCTLPAGPATRGGRRSTIDHVVVNRAASETIDFVMDAIKRSLKVNVHVMGPNTEFRH
jgi:hypothetical protein